VYQLCLV